MSRLAAADGGVYPGGMHSPRIPGPRSLRFASATTGCVVALMLAGCSSNDEPVKITPAQSASAMQAGAAAKAAAAMSGNASTARPDAGANPHAGGMGGAMSGSAPKAGIALQYAVPEGWIVQIPTSSMRKAQFQLPREADDPEDAALILYYFGGEGGSKDANLERWAGQFVQPDGRSSHDVLVTTTRTVNDMAVTEASISGTFDAELMPGQGDRVRLENWGMLAAIIETPAGPYYAKLTGPAPTVSRWEASFRQWISSLKPASG